MPLLRSLLWLLLALFSLGAAWTFPAYFQSVASSVLVVAGREGPTTLEEAETLALAGRPRAAEFLAGNPVQADAARAFPLWSSFARNFRPPATVEGEPAIAPLLSRDGRQTAKRLLRQSETPAVAVFLDALPPPADPASSDRLALAENLADRMGILLAAFLAAEQGFRPGFLGELVQSAEAETGRGQRTWRAFHRSLLQWGLLAPRDALPVLLENFASPGGFLEFSRLAASPGSPDRTLLLRLLLADVPAAPLSLYLQEYPETATADLTSAFRDGPAAATLLVERSLPRRPPQEWTARWIPPDDPYRQGLESFWAGWILERPAASRVLRIFLLLLGSYGLVRFLAGVFPNPGDRYLRPPYRGQRFLRSSMSAIVLMGVFLLVQEPQLLRQSQEPLLAGPPTLDMGAPALASQESLMNTLPFDQVTLLILAVFLLLQFALYLFCLIKLSEIRRQPLPEVTKLELLANEENLFDSGLYLGLGGTVASLILLATGVVEASLMAAYASTLFGILSVAFFKIFHLRPFRRQLILATRGEFG
jgi:hypothetical protein